MGQAQHMKKKQFTIVTEDIASFNVGLGARLLLPNNLFILCFLFFFFYVQKVRQVWYIVCEEKREKDAKQM